MNRMLSGASEKEIASVLGISVHTVHTHVKRVYRACGVNSRPELLARHIVLGGGQIRQPFAFHPPTAAQ